MTDEDDFSKALFSDDPQRMAEFVELYTQHYQRLQYYVMALLPMPNDSADVLQETSLVLWKKFDTFESGTNFFAWACKIARLQTKKHYQRHSRASRLLDEATLQLIAKEAMDSQSKSEVPLEILESCLERLDESDRKLICRRYEPDTTVKQIAAELGVTANYLSKTFGRIRRSLLTCIQGKLAKRDLVVDLCSYVLCSYVTTPHLLTQQ